MKKVTHFCAGILLIFALICGFVVDEPVTVYAAAGTFVQPYADMIGQGGYIYYIRTSETDGSCGIWRMKVATGKASKVVEESGTIVKMAVCGQRLYYTAPNDNSGWEVRSCRLNGDDLQTVCGGVVCYANSENIYCIRTVNETQSRLYVKNIATGKNTSIRTVKAGQVLDYVGTVGNDSYYYIYDGKTDKLALYRLHTATNQLIRIATEKRVVEDSNAVFQVSDVRQIDGELYYNFGSYEGSGNFWNGTIKKLTVDGKKKTVAKLVSDDQIIFGSRELYFTNPTGNNYKYNLKTGKKEQYSLKFEENISYTIFGDKTYMADTSDRKKIVISRFTSGTDRETLTKGFISIPFKQKSNVSYGVSLKQIGIYNMVCVTGRDYTDASYGWRGKLVSIDWFITDGAGTLLGSFR
ncbi:MAG: DUF5050 domain-containing protein [Lachnospiraceae bacterium]|nr:DUF5050 domain-containing protein [bacterium]MDY5516012.1 DUF5050 domain-containing protein [Lachnospiraceae bacterium]